MSKPGVLQVGLPPDVLAEVERHAKPLGLKPSVFARTLIMTALAGMPPAMRKPPKKEKP